MTILRTAAILFLTLPATVWLGACPWTVAAAVIRPLKDGRLEATRIGKKYQIARESLQKYFRTPSAV